MTLSDYKMIISDRWRLLGANIRHSYEIDTAYFFNNWAGFLSTLLYTLTYILFINVVFANVKNLGSFDRNQMYFLMFLAQLNFYSLVLWSTDNLKDLIEEVNTGALDFVLSRPLPSLFYITFRRIYVVSFLRDGVVPLALLAYLINWPQLHLQLPTILIGVIIFICGQISMHVIQFLLAVPVFWTGESGQVFNLTYAISSSDVIPYDGLPRFFQITLRTVVPIFISTVVATSVLLHKLAAGPTLLSCALVALIALLLQWYVWKKALQSYTSASS